jgi:predicted ATPase/DNA-binding winged helix-turn-helix (wHTH) protein
MPTPSKLPSALRVDPGNGCLWRGARAIALRPKTLAVLCCLAQYPGQLVTHADLLHTVWADTAVGAGGLAVCIRELRRALDDDANSPRVIETVHRRGYRLVGHVTMAAALADVARPATLGPSQAQPASRPHPGSSRPVGRGAELQQLRRWLTASREGTRQVVFVTGEPGLGKTTLVDAFIDGLKEQQGGLLITRGQCVEHYGAGEAYLPVLEALGRLCREPRQHEVVDVLARRAPTWLVHMPWLVRGADLEVLQRQTSGVTHERMLREMAEAIEVLTAERTLVLVLEDLHWSDRSTLGLLACLARRREPARLLLVGTYRPAEVGLIDSPLPAFPRELLAHGQCAELPLTFLSEVSIQEYLAGRFPAGPIPPRLSRLLHQRTDGNPLFLINLLEYWLAEGTLACEAGALVMRARLDELAIGVPANLRQMIERWVDRLGQKQQLILEVGSVAGLDFSAAAVAAGLRRDVSEVDERCAGLVRRGQLLRASGEKSWPDGTVAGGYAFAHALYQETLYLRVAPARRQQWHRLIGARQEAAYGARAGEVATQLAVHFERGGEYRKAIAYLREAADGAVRRCANADAMEHLAKGVSLLEALGDAPDRTRLELDLLTASGPVLMAIKGYGAPEVERAYARAQTLCARLGNDAPLFAVLRGLVAFRQQRGELLAAGRLARRLFALAQRAKDPALLLRAHQAHGTTLFYRGEPTAARRNLERGLAIYRRHTRDARGVRSGLSTAVICLGHDAWALWLIGYPDEALRRSHEALELAQELSHPHSIVYALHFCCVVHQFRGEVEAVRERAEAVVALATEQGFAFWRAYGAIMQGWALAVRESAREGLDLMRQHLVSLRATGAELGRTYFLALLGEACAQGRRTETGLRAIAEGLAPIGNTGEHFYEAELHRLRGELLRRGTGSGRVATKQRLRWAEESFRRALQVARRHRATSLELRAAMSLSRLWQQHGRRDAARQLVAQVSARFTEGLDTGDLKNARKLLAR